MRGSHPGTLLSSASTLKEPNNSSVGTNTAYSNITGVHTHTKVVHTNSIHGSGHKQYMVVATNSTHTKVVHTNSICGGGHKQYTY